MGVRLVAPNVLHCWMPSGFRVIRLAEADDVHVAAAVTCALGAHNSLWVASSSAFLRRVVVKASRRLQPFVLPQGFLCDASREDAFPHSDLATRLRVGQVQSISAHVRAGRNDCSAASCRCVMEVFGTTGFAAVGFHDGTVDVAFDWDRVPDGTAITHVVTSGRLLDAIRPAGFAAPAIFAITAAGRLRAAVGSSFLNVHDRKKWTDGSCDVISLCQTPVLLFSDPSNSFLVVLGCFRAGVVLYVGRGGKLATRRFVFKGGKGRLTRSAIRVVEEEDSKLVLEEVQAHRTNISYDADEGAVAIDLDCNRAASRSKEEGSEDHSFAMRALLQGIEDLGEREKHYEISSRSTVDLVTSYNAAILFATEWKTQCSPGDLIRSQRDACSVRAVVSDSAGHARLRSSLSELGKEILLIVSFTNKSQARLSEGWAIRVRLKKASASSEWFSGMTEDYSAAFREQESKSDGSDSTDIVRVMANPLPTVPSGGAAEVSFPVVVNSHSPLQASVSLHFRHPCANKIGINSPDVELMLIEDELFDILDLSSISERGDLQDSHHGVLSSTSLAAFFNTEVSESRRAFSIVSRFNAPLSFEKAAKVLNFIASSPQRESLLGAQYSLALAPSESHRINDDENRCSTVTIRGAACVIPFVRAAVLRRLIASGSLGHADPVRLPNAGVLDSRRSHISFSDEGAECLASFRRAECELSKTIRTYRDSRCQESLELRRDGNDRETLHRAILRARETYNFWRRQIEGI